MEEFLKESRAHGWPSFRGTLLLSGGRGRQRLCRQMKVSHSVAFLDEEVHWENVRVLPNGEAVSPDGTHLGHNLVRDCDF